MVNRKIDDFCCPHCGNKKNYWVRFVKATLHLKEFKEGMIFDFEHDIKDLDMMIARYDCCECMETTIVNDMEEIKLTTAELQKSDS